MYVAEFGPVTLCFHNHQRVWERSHRKERDEEETHIFDFDQRAEEGCLGDDA